MSPNTPNTSSRNPLSAVATLAGRIVLAVAALAVVALGFFFLAAALVAGGILAAVILVRFWWWRRKLRKAAEAEYVTAEYTVVERENPRDPRLPPGP